MLNYLKNNQLPTSKQNVRIIIARTFRNRFFREMYFHGNPDKFESITENSRNSICSFSKLIYCRDLCHWKFVKAEIGR